MPPAASPRVARFSTRHLADAQCRSQWEQWNRTALIGLDTATPDGRGLRADETNLDLPGVSLARVRAGAHRVRRDAETVARCPADALVVYVMVTGSTVFTDRGHFGPMTAAVTDADRPFERSFARGFTELVVKVPGRAGPRFDIRGVAGPHALRVRALTRQLTVVGQDPSWDPLSTRTVALDLVAGLTGDAGPGDRLALARLLIDHQLSDPTLSARRLAAAMGVSERQLSRLFAEAGASVPTLVTRRRLERAGRLLSDPARPVADIARACGFSSTSYFDRVFRDCFGVTPSRYRGA